jgi:biopolymer transport protein ExbB
MFEFLRAGGPFMILLVLTSIVAVTFIIERGLALRWRKVIPDAVLHAVSQSHIAEEPGELYRTCREYPSALSRLLMLAEDHKTWPKAENQDALQTQARHEILLLDRHLVILEIVVGIAPLLGLVGTIHGLITLFGDLGQAGMSDNSALARGIAIALNTTLMGLMIAIPSLVAWSYYNKKVETFGIEMERLCEEYLRRQSRAKKKI